MPTKIVVLGIGRWGKTWLRVLENRLDVTVTATAGGSLENSSGSKMNTHYPDFRAAIREVEADAVIITLPVHLHAEAILAALDAGLHVLCEKPAVANSDELERIVQHTNKTDRTVMIAQNYR